MKISWPRHIALVISQPRQILPWLIARGRIFVFPSPPAHNFHMQIKQVDAGGRVPSLYTFFPTNIYMCFHMNMCYACTLHSSSVEKLTKPWTMFFLFIIICNKQWKRYLFWFIEIMQHLIAKLFSSVFGNFGFMYFKLKYYIGSIYLYACITCFWFDM